MTSLSSWWCSWSRPKLLTHHLRRPPPDPCFFTPRAPVTPPFLVSILFGNNTALWSLPQSEFFCPATHLLWAFTHSPSNFFSLQGPIDRQDPALAPEPVGICSTCYTVWFLTMKGENTLGAHSDQKPTAITLDQADF